MDQIIAIKYREDKSFFVNKMNKLFDELLQKKDQNLIYSEMFYSLGSVLGAFLGDALGSYYEFKFGEKDMYQENEVFILENSVWGTSPGQITDDSEMALSLGYGIMDSVTEIPNFNKVAYYYGYWLFSSPFDIGNTTRNAVGTVKLVETYKDLPKELQPKSRIIKPENYFYFEDIYFKGFVNNCKIKNYESASNGFIMRKTPLAIYCMRYVRKDKIQDMDEDHIYDIKSLSKACVDDTSLSHSNPTTHTASIIYSLVITRIIYLRTHFPKFNEVGKNTLNYLKKHIYKLNDKTFDLKEMLNLIEKGKPNEIEFTPKMFHHSMCWYLYGLLYSLYALIDIDTKGDYYTTIKNVINLGGDTDTNAAIVGGVIGAYYGPQNLESNKLKTLIEFNPYLSNSRHNRPSVYSPGFVMFVAETIFENKVYYNENKKNYFEDEELKNVDHLPITVSRLLQYFAN